jgi:hypothetical protein
MQEEERYLYLILTRFCYTSQPLASLLALLQIQRQQRILNHTMPICTKGLSHSKTFMEIWRPKRDISFAGSTCNHRKVGKTFDVAVIRFSLKATKHKKHCEIYCPVRHKGSL